MTKRKVKGGSRRKLRTLSNPAQKVSGMSELSVKYALSTPTIADYAKGMKMLTTAGSRLNKVGISDSRKQGHK
jgi:hypothetical protein